MHSFSQFESLRTYWCPQHTCVYAGYLLHYAALSRPNRIALYYESTTQTFEELYAAALKITHTLTSQGIGPDDRVVLLIENHPFFYEAYYGAWQTGAIVAPLNSFLTQQEVQYILDDAKPAAIICSESFKSLIDSCSHTAHVFTPSSMGSTTDPLSIQPIDPHRCAALLYTSGTTGRPKGVMLSSHAIITNSIQGIANFEVQGSEKILAALPLFHSYMQNTCVWSPCIAGVSVILVPKITRKDLLNALSLQPTIILGIPQIYGLLCMFRNAPLDTVELFVSGGDHLPDKIRMAFELLYARKICNGYGMTESGPFISVDLEDHLAPTSMVGGPMIGVQVELRPSPDQQPNDPMTLWVSGENLMLGYYNAPEATAAVLRDGWLDTGDQAYLDHKQRIYLAGRSKDLIIHRGVNVYPAEIENVLSSHPALLMAAVIGIQRNDTEEPIAYVVPRSKPADPDALIAELLTRCRSLLAEYKVPVELYIVEELPRTATGKVDKKLLRARYAQAPSKD